MKNKKRSYLRQFSISCIYNIQNYQNTTCDNDYMLANGLKILNTVWRYQSWPVSR